MRRNARWRVGPCISPCVPRPESGRPGVGDRPTAVTPALHRPIGRLRARLEPDGPEPAHQIAAPGRIPTCTGRPARPSECGWKRVGERGHGRHGGLDKQTFSWKLRRLSTAHNPTFLRSEALTGRMRCRESADLARSSTPAGVAQPQEWNRERVMHAKFLFDSARDHAVRVRSRAVSARGERLRLSESPAPTESVNPA